MTAPFELVLAGDPVGKGRPRFSRASGHVYTPEKSARFEERLAWAAQSVWQGKPLMDGQIIMFINAYFSIPVSKPKDWKIRAMAGIVRPVKKPDIDNIVKGVADALNKVVYVDDTQIVMVKAAKFYSDKPRIEIQIYPSLDIHD
jgi:Holliday junction resolvase RusA-like endonuclease